MKFSFTKNDKSTVMDEIILTVIVLVCLAVGILLIITKPGFGFVSQSMTTVLGVMFVLAAVMYTPGLIYRFMTNDKK